MAIAQNFPTISIPVSQISANSDYGYIKDFFTNIG